MIHHERMLERLAVAGANVNKVAQIAKLPEVATLFLFLIRPTVTPFSYRRIFNLNEVEKFKRICYIVCLVSLNEMFFSLLFHNVKKIERTDE